MAKIYLNETGTWTEKTLNVGEQARVCVFPYAQKEPVSADLLKKTAITQGIIAAGLFKLAEFGVSKIMKKVKGKRELNKHEARFDAFLNNA